MKHALVPALFAATLSGCASDPVQLENDKTYRVEWIGERPLIDRSHLTITLGEDGRAYGSAGCNHWFASYRRDGDALRFEQPGATRKLCAPALMEQEQRFLKQLAASQIWNIDSAGTLTLVGTSGVMVAKRK